MIKKFLPTVALASLAPAVAFAQATNVTYLDGLLSNISALLGRLPALLIAVAVVYFLWGVVNFVSAGDNEDKRASGRKSMIWGLVGIAVMVSLWGIITLLQTVFGIGGGSAPPAPTLPS